MVGFRFGFVRRAENYRYSDITEERVFFTLLNEEFVIDLSRETIRAFEYRVQLEFEFVFLDNFSEVIHNGNQFCLFGLWIKECDINSGQTTVIMLIVHIIHLKISIKRLGVISRLLPGAKTGSEIEDYSHRAIAYRQARSGAL